MTTAFFSRPIPYFLCGIFLFFSVTSTNAATESKHNPSNQEVSYKNSWINIRISYKDKIEMTKFDLGPHSFLWPTSADRGYSEPFHGATTALFETHPMKSSQLINPGTAFEATALPVADASDAAWEIHSVSSTNLSIKKEFHASSLNSILSVTTTITNVTESEISFFPTEVICEDAKTLQGQKPFFFCPSDQKFSVITGEKDRKNLEILPINSIFSAQYENKIGEVALHSPKNWFVLYEGKKGWGCDIDVEYISENIEPIDDNRILYINGQGQIERDGTILFKTKQAEPYMRIMAILGKVTLKPGQSFSYQTRWSGSTSFGPIYDYRNGIQINTPLKAYTVKNSFLLIGAMGIARYGGIGFEFWDKDNKLIAKNLNMSLNMSLSRPAPRLNNPLFPCVLSHQITFTSKEILDKIHRITMVLTDGTEKIIQQIDEVTGPFTEYKGKIE